MLTLSHKVSCRGIPSSEIDSVWSIAKPLIQKALDQGSDFTIEEIHEGLLEASMQLWLWGEETALVTRIQSNKRKKFCLLLALGGSSMSEWLQYLPSLEDWARDQGAEEVRIYGRAGWSKVLGYDIDYVTMSKKL